MKNKLNKDVVSVLYKHIPQTKELAHYLMDILDLGKESVYRRLRSEVPFTFDEVCVIAMELGISVDCLIGLKNPDCAVFRMHMYKSTEPVEVFLEILKSNTDMIKKLGQAKSLKMCVALNRLPYGITLYQESLAKFYYYKWLFHMQKGDAIGDFSDFKLPDAILDECKRYLYESERLNNCEIDVIVDENVFLYMIKEINYFRKRGLIKDSDMFQLKEDMFRTVDLTENITKKGVSKSGANLRFHLSVIDIEPCYSYIEYDENVCTSFWTSSGEIITSCSPKLCERKKRWIESLKRYTTLITQCNEIHQIEYLNTQRMLIEDMTKGIATERTI